MEEMSASVSTPAGPETQLPGDRTAPRDLRDWIMAAEPLGQLHRIKEEVDRDEEMGAITYMAHQTINAPALLFEQHEPDRAGRDRGLVPDDGPRVRSGPARPASRGASSTRRSPWWAPRSSAAPRRPSSSPAARLA